MNRLMKNGTAVHIGTLIKINCSHINHLSVDRGRIRIDDQELEDYVASMKHAVSEVEIVDDFEECSENEPAEHCPFSDEQVKRSGIRCQPRVALALMYAMRTECIQKVDWLSFYSVLLRRCWIDSNVRAYCHMVIALFGVELDHRTLSRILTNLGSTDYTEWADADKRIVRRKRLAAEYEHRLTAYFERKRKEVMNGLV